MVQWRLSCLQCLLGWSLWSVLELEAVESLIESGHMGG